MAKRKRGAKRPIRLLVSVSDLHCGSKVAVCPPRYDKGEGEYGDANAVQRWLWDRWVEFSTEWVPSVVGDEPYALVVNGDVIEGDHHHTTEIVSKDPAVHRWIASEVLSSLAANAERLYMTVGTECHVRNSEDILGRELGAEVCRTTGSRAAQHWMLQINGTLCSFRHHISASSRIALYASALSIALAEEQAQAVRVGHDAPTVIGRSHRHTFGHYGDARALIFTHPAWQALTRHGHKVVPASKVSCGGVVLDFRDRAPGSLPTLHSWVRAMPDAGFVVPEVMDDEDKDN